MSFDIQSIRSPKEQPLFVIGVVLSTMAWIALAVSLVGLLYGALILVFVLMAHALFLANVRGNGVRVSERQLPSLYARVRAAAEKLGMDRVPEMYLLQSHGVLNAFATKLLSRRFIIVHSSLADACGDQRQLDFVIGHELGHLAAGHLRWNAFLAPYRLVPWLGAAYSRAREYTCDRCGLMVAGDLEQSMRGLAVLAAGGRHANEVDLAAFEEQRLESGSFWMSVLELVSSHPFLCKRAAALREYVRPGSAQPVTRNVLAYPLAPLFGVAAAPAGGASASLALVVIAVFALTALQGVRKYVEQAHANAVEGAAWQQRPAGPFEEAPSPARPDLPVRRDRRLRQGPQSLSQ